jgi:hypothetical protein
VKLGGRGILLVAVSVVVAGAIVIGFLLLGTPQDARKHQLDRKRIEDLRMLANGLIARARDANPDSLPPTLDAVTLTNYMKDAGRDPVTGAAYGYHIVGGGRFELCATFDTAESEAEFYDWERSWAHPAGPYCFQFDVAGSAIPQPIKHPPK